MYINTVTIGFDDGTKGFFYNDISNDNANCMNTCATSRGPSSTKTEFIDCTGDFTNCFDATYYHSTFAPDRTYIDNINKIRVAFFNAGLWKVEVLAFVDEEGV